MATKVGLGVAVDYALGWGIDAISTRINELDGGHARCGIVTF